MYLETPNEPILVSGSITPSRFSSSYRGKRFFCPVCGCPLWKELMGKKQYSIPWTILELSKNDLHLLVLAAEIYTETQPAFWRLTGQYARFLGSEYEKLRCVESKDSIFMTAMTRTQI